jgi:hypothetical protein
MMLFAQDGAELLDKTKFRFEDRLPAGDRRGTQVAIYAFKAWQLRVYGGMSGDESEFICTEIDSSKKADSADQNKLKRAAKKLGTYL